MFVESSNIDKNKIDRIVELHNKLTGKFKEYENCVGKHPPLDVLNELRYALRALMEFLARLPPNVYEGQANDELDHLAERLHHAFYCAYHDLIDGLAIDLSERMDILLDHRAESAIAVLGPKRIEVVDFLNEVSDKISESRRDPPNRYKIYDKELYEGHFAKLIEIKRFLARTAWPEIIVHHAHLKRKKRIERGLWAFGILLAILGIVVSL